MWEQVQTPRRGNGGFSRDSMRLAKRTDALSLGVPGSRDAVASKTVASTSA